MAGTVVARLGSRALQVAVSLMWLATPSLAEHAWVKDDLRLNLRAGPGLEFQTLGVIKTGDDVDVLERTPAGPGSRSPASETAGSRSATCKPIPRLDFS